MQTVRSWGPVVVAAVLAGCAAAPAALPAAPSAGPSAQSLCRDALPGHHVVSGTWTTVGAVRTWIRGGVQQQKDLYPLARAFPSAAPLGPAAWCWTRDEPDTDVAWAVLPQAPPVHAISITCQGCGASRPTPSGAPLPVP